MKQLEKQIEENVCSYAKKLGIYVRKFSSPGQRAVPDRLFIAPGAKVFFIEFKAPGKQPNKLQEREHKLIRNKGVPVFIVDNVTQGREIIDNLEELLTRKT